MEKNIQDKLLNIKAVVFDSVGVIFSEVCLYDSEKGEIIRARSHADGQGISFLRAIGIKVAFITSETNNFLEILGNKLNNLPAVKEGKMSQIEVITGCLGRDKIDVVTRWLDEQGFSLTECAYMGDDVGDFAIMDKVGLAVAPSNAEKIIKDISHLIVERRGGDGAIRDFSNILLDAKNIDVKSLVLK